MAPTKTGDRTPRGRSGSEACHRRPVSGETVGHSCHPHGGRGPSSTPGLGPVGYSTRRVRHPEGPDKGLLDRHTQARADPYAFLVVAGGELPVNSSPPSPESPQLEDYSCSKGPPMTAKRMEWESIRTWHWAWVQGAEPCLGPGNPDRGCRGGPHPMGGNDLKSLDPRSAGRTEATPLAGRTAGPDGG